jgi:hypothetical protein
MKQFLITLLLACLTLLTVFGQNENEDIDAPLGLRIERNGQDYLIYADKNLSPNFEDYRKLNYQVYFRKVNHPEKEIDGEKYQLISIPGSSNKKDQEDQKTLADGTVIYPRAGKTISKEDYDNNFWIEVGIIEKHTTTEYYKYANDVFSGLLTAPFKYRLKLGNAPESLIDGDFNIAPFIGWKWRVSSARPFYVSPFGFAGVTSLNFNSANNSKISEADRLENGTGLTYGLGLSLRFGNVSPGVVVGWDKGFGDMGSGFFYNDKAWISFSVNYDFFKPEKTSEGDQK